MTDNHSSTGAGDLNRYTAGSAALMTLFRHVRALRGGEKPEAPAWVAPTLADVLESVRERAPAEPDVLRAAQQQLAARLQRMAQVAMREVRTYRDGPYQVWEGVLLAGFRTLCEQRAFALGWSYALTVAPGAVEPSAEGDRRVTTRTLVVWGEPEPAIAVEAEGESGDAPGGVQ